MALGINFESMSFFRLWGDLWAMSKVESSPRVPRLLGFILLVSLSGALFVVSILSIFCECHLGSLLRSWSYWGFLCWLWVFVGLGRGGLVGRVRGRGFGVRASAAGVCPAGGLWWRFGRGL